MNPLLEVFSQGEEIVTGHTVDTNAAWLSQQAVRLGFIVSRHTAVGDKLDDLVALLQEIAQRADCCICTGGLGPTQDDLTAEAVALAFGLALQFDLYAYTQIEKFFTLRNRAMPESNRKQALLPEGSLRIDNQYGTAPGFAVLYQRCWFVFLPGVPSEMRPMFTDTILPLLHGRFSLQPSTLISVRTFGIGESAIQQALNALVLPSDVQLGFRAGANEVETKLLFPYAYPKTAMTALVDKVADLLGETVFAIDSQEDESTSMAQVVSQLMEKGGHTLTLLETASQGLLTSLCVGAQWLLESRYEQKQEQFASHLGIAIEENLSEFAIQLAYAAQKNSHATWTLVQLYQGSCENLQNKDVAILLHIVLLTENEVHQCSHTVVGTNKRKQSQAALLSLDLLRRVLQFGQYSKLSNGGNLISTA